MAAVDYAQRTMPDIRLQVLRGVDHQMIPVMMSAADCLLVTSDREGSPNIVREALACNLPVVSVSVGDIPELLSRDASSGILAARDADQLGEALVKIMKKPRPASLFHLIAENSLEKTAERITRIYEAVIEKNRLIN